MSVTQLDICNTTIDGEKYYNPNIKSLSNVGGNFVSAGWNFMQFACCCVCFICMLIILGIMAAGASSMTSLIILAIPTLIFCICSTYHYYNYYQATSDLKNTNITSQSLKRPCKDPNKDIVYTN